MEEIKTKGIILKTKDYAEADKIATIFSLDYGKISAKFVGVKKAKARLKPLIQPFTFVEVECIKKGDFYTVKTGVVIDTFAKITSDYSKTICAYIIMDIIAQVLPKNKIEPNIFLEVVKTLDNIEEKNPYITTIDFIVRFFSILGENLDLKLEASKVYLDLNLGNFTNNRTTNSIEVDKKCYQNISTPTDNDNLNKMTLKLLNNIFKAKYETDLNTFSFL